MSERVPILTPHPELIPKRISRELRSIVDDTQKCFGEYPLPPIIVRIDCFFRINPRNFAGVLVGDPTDMFLCEDLANQPLTRIRGILYHEMGHILQWIEKELTGRNKLDGRDFEQDCDHKIEAICGIKIFYDDDLVQMVGPRAKGMRPRPRGLK